MDILKKVKKRLTGLLEISERNLDRVGYFESNWDTIRELVGDDIIEAYELGRHEATYDVCLSILKIVGDIDEED